MRTREQNFLTMAHTVNEVVKRHQPKWITAERFAQSAEVLNDLVGFITDINAAADSDITGAAKDKAAIFTKAGEEGLKLAKRTKVYASDKKDHELKQRLTISRSDLFKQHGAELLATLKDWIVRLNPIIGELAPYGVLPADLSYFKTLVNDLDKLLTRPRELIVARKTTNQSELPNLLTQTEAVLESMDNLINLFEATPFESEFLNARKVVELGGRRDKPDEEEEKPDEEKPETEDEKPEPPVV
jgi:hypothetical protein